MRARHGQQALPGPGRPRRTWWPGWPRRAGRPVHARALRMPALRFPRLVAGIPGLTGFRWLAVGIPRLTRFRWLAVGIPGLTGFRWPVTIPGLLGQIGPFLGTIGGLAGPLGSLSGLFRPRT